MFFGNGLGEAFFARWPRTADPDRIHAIDRRGRHLPPLKASRLKPSRTPPSPTKAHARPCRNSRGILADRHRRRNGTAPVIRTNSVLPNLGNPTTLHLRYASNCATPCRKISSRCRDPLAATSLIYALLLAPDEKLRAQQLAEIASRSPAPLPDRPPRSSGRRRRGATRALPLVNLALGALRNLTAAQFKSFADTLEWLAAATANPVVRIRPAKDCPPHLASKFGSAAPTAVQFYTLKPSCPTAP